MSILRQFLYRGLLAAAFMCAAGITIPLSAQESFRATHVASLEASEEPGGVDDAIANGIGIFRVDRNAGTIEYRVSVTGLSNITMAHIHGGARGENGRPAITLDITDTMHTASGIATDVRPTFIDSLLAGLAYVNVHTDANPAGHIRGQIIDIPNAVAAAMTASQEVGSVTADSGTGNAALYIDEATLTARYFVDWDKLSGVATAGHFHMGAPGTIGPPVHGFTLDPLRTDVSGVWNMTQEQFDALKNGLIYVNIHTVANSGGEIRGIVLPADLYTAAVTAGNEVPSHADASRGVGTATSLVLRSPVGGLVAVSSVVDHMTGPITMAHIHRGALGVGGPPVITLNTGLTESNWDTFGAAITNEDIINYAAVGMYANFHTGTFPNGEMRGQMIPAATNLSFATSAVPLADVSSMVMTATHDRANRTLTLRLPESSSAGGTLDIYSSIGVRVSSLPATSTTVSVDTRDMASGAYFARLVVNGRVTANARVAIQ